MSSDSYDVAQHKWEWVKRIIAMVVGIVVAVVISIYLQRDNQITNCRSSGPRAALSARFANDAAGARAADAKQFKDLYDKFGRKEDQKAYKKFSRKARQYRATAQGQLATIAIPKGVKIGDPRLGKVRLIDGSPDKYVLVNTASKLQRQGCEQLFPPPIPFIR